MGIQNNIHETISSLTSAEKRAAHALLANYPSVGLATVAEFASEAATSAPTILRFVARLGFESYPDFQRALRNEIEAGLLSPLQKRHPDTHLNEPEPTTISQHVECVDQNMRTTLNAVPKSEFESACNLISDTKSGVYFLGGRFTDAIAAYMASHLRIVRPGIRRFNGQVSTWNDQILDIKPGDVAVILDIRRYQKDLLDVAKALTNRKVKIILITDVWLSPVSKYAKIVLPCGIETEHTWDSNAALFILAEAIIVSVTRANWNKTRKRLQAIEDLHWNKTE
ncbi:MAG: MurR/RpiR family transcriptional regulator [Cohaesibacteraceae bacterium]|nr:MurR/RpiR family transcriptional regulator [Cohaesibacteraceae bacterium]